MGRRDLDLIQSFCCFNLQAAPPTISSDRQCAPLTTCTSGFFESRAPQTSLDRVCTGCQTCDANTHIESGGCTQEVDRVCTKLTTCPKETYESAPSSATADRVCTTHTIGLPNEYVESFVVDTSGLVSLRLP